MPKKTEYYYYPGQERYLKILKRLAKIGGSVSNMLALYTAIMNDETLNPERQLYFENDFDGDVDYLKRRVDSTTADMRNVWMTFLRASDAMGIPRNRDRNGADFELYKRFYLLLRELEEVCDLRKMIHTWVNNDLRRINNGGICVVSPNPDLIAGRKEIVLLSVPEIMERYNTLLEKRRGKKPGV